MRGGGARAPPAARERPNDALVAAVDDSLEDLANEQDPRRAVIKAYDRMERALAANGAARDRAETPVEYLRRALGAVQASQASIRRLTDLFEQARFSRHTIDGEMKLEAIGALTALRAELDGAAERTGGGVTRSALGWAAAILVAAFLIVLAVPREHRALALYAFLLLARALVLGGAGGADARAGRPPATTVASRARRRRPSARRPELEALEQDVREVLATGAVEDRLRAQIRGDRGDAPRPRARRSTPRRRGRRGGAGRRRTARARCSPPRCRPRARPPQRRGELGAAVHELERL